MRPEAADCKIKAFKKHIPHDFIVDKVTLLSTGEELSFERNEEEMVIRATDAFKSDMPICFKVELA